MCVRAWCPHVDHCLKVIRDLLYPNFRLCLLLGVFKLVSVDEISASLGHGKRNKILNHFKNGKIQVCNVKNL